MTTLIDNGRRAPLVIPGLFAGIAGMSRGQVAFAPQPGVKPLATYAATLDGQPVVLTNVQPAGDGRSYTAQVLG
jgi:hypothetical protein